MRWFFLLQEAHILIVGYLSFVKIPDAWAYCLVFLLFSPSLHR